METIVSSINGHQVIMVLPQSKIGFVYPRLFIEVNQFKYVNFDLTLEAVFAMTREQFNSWLDGSEFLVDNIEEYLVDIGINYEEFIKVFKLTEEEEED